MFQLPTAALPRVRVALRRPPSRTLFSTGLPSQMFAQVLVHVGVILPLHAAIDQHIYQVIIEVYPTVLSDVLLQFSQVLGGIVRTSLR